MRLNENCGKASLINRHPLSKLPGPALTSLKKKAILDPQVSRNLQKNQAIAILSLNSQSRDDVIDMRGVFV